MLTTVIVEDEPIELEPLRQIIFQCVESTAVHEASTGRKVIRLTD